MVQKTSPFNEAKYGWDFGESGWNVGMDENILKFSYLFDSNIDGVVDSLPSLVNGRAYYLTSDKRIYFSVSDSWYSTPIPKWFILKNKSDGSVVRFNGDSLIPVADPNQLQNTLNGVNQKLDTLGSAAYVNVEDLALESNLDQLRDSFLDPETGAKLVGWNRGQNLGLPNVDESLNSQIVNLWEFAEEVSDKPDANDPTTWDWSPAVQAAVDYCNASFPAKKLAVSMLCRLGSSIVINRPIDGDSVRDTFWIVGLNGGGFRVTTAIPMFTSTLPAADAGGYPAPCTQTVKLFNLVLTSDNADLAAYIFDGNKFLRTWVEGCDISRLKMAATNSYFQSLYLNCNNIRYWKGIFLEASGGAYDVRVNPGNLVEQGEHFLLLIDSSGTKSVTGCYVDGSCIEGLSGFGIAYSHVRGFAVTNCYFEANALPDIIGDNFPTVVNYGVHHSGNMHAASQANKSNPDYWAVQWGATSGGSSEGNFSDARLNRVRANTFAIFNDHADVAAVSDLTRSSPGGIMRGSVSPAVNNAPYGNRRWGAGDVVFNNSGALEVAGWVCVAGGTPGTWYPFGPSNDGAFWRFQNSQGQDFARISTVDDFAAGQTGLFIRCSANGGYVTQRVELGAPDSGGVGYRILRTVN